MKLDARFAASALAPEHFPRWDRSEIALAGRSNVGKSSLLNALAGIKGLARVSKTPGRTRAINFFTVGQNLALVDLPGYGYARVAHAVAEKLSALMTGYLENRRGLIGLVMLVDCRRGLEAPEFRLAELAAQREIELIVAATKSDKLRHADRPAALERLKPLGVTPILCSGREGEGLEELRRALIRLAGQSRFGPHATARGDGKPAL
jgi:GTP-binding protein